jgi:DNA-binding HxlR family transcriptional regulator
MVDEWGSAEEAVGILSGRWTLTVLSALSEESRSHNELARRTGLHNKQLERVLARLEKNGVVARENRGCGHRVFYRLTATGSCLVDAVSTLAGWRDHFGSVSAAQADRCSA